MDIDNIVEKFVIRRITGDEWQDVDDIVTGETPLTIILNNVELVTLLCTPISLKYLAAGYLVSEGFIQTKDDIKTIVVDDNHGIVRVETKEDNDIAAESFARRMITTGCGRGATFYNVTDVQDKIKVKSEIKVTAASIFSILKELQQKSELYRNTGGVHSAALCSTQSLLVFSEDVGRHNAIDKIFGQCLLEDIAMDNCLVITSGRISSEILLKVAKRNIAIIASRSAPTNLGVRLADELGITLIGFVRGQRFNCYTHNWRIAEPVA